MTASSVCRNYVSAIDPNGIQHSILSLQLHKMLEQNVSHDNITEALGAVTTDLIVHKHGVVFGDFVVIGDLCLTGDLTVMGSLLVTGVITAGESASNVQLSCKSLYAGKIYSDKISITATNDVYSLHRHGEGFVCNSIHTTDLSLVGAVRVNRLFVAGDMKFSPGKSGVDITSDYGVVVNYNFVIGGNLMAEGEVRVYCDFVANGSTFIGENLYVTGNVITGSDLHICGEFSASTTNYFDVFINGTLRAERVNISTGGYVCVAEFIVNSGHTATIVAKEIYSRSLKAPGAGVVAKGRLTVPGEIVVNTINVVGDIHCGGMFRTISDDAGAVRVEGNVTTKRTDLKHPPIVTGKYTITE